jgi:hypothetical protein
MGMELFEKAAFSRKINKLPTVFGPDRFLPSDDKYPEKVSMAYRNKGPILFPRT